VDSADWGAQAASLWVSAASRNESLVFLLRIVLAESLLLTIDEDHLSAVSDLA